jgi:magnesium chelatase family protein
MPISRVLSRTPAGLAAPLVEVEVHLGIGLPVFSIVGLPETVVRESKERVRSALVNSGFEFPMRRMTVNLAPADLPKEGGRFDLPIAIGVLVATEQLGVAATEGREFYGELSLGGELRETRALLPALLAGAATRRELIMPMANELEASFAATDRILLAASLREVTQALSTGAPLRRAVPRQHRATPNAWDLADVRGQFAAKRALEIAAAGEHALLFIGPPGSGKTLLAQRLPGLLPALSPSEATQVASLASAAGRRPEIGHARPFRQPQHTASIAAMVGGGTAMRPGEMSLAHSGVLFLDEFPEFPRNTLESLREPLESGIVTLSRAKRSCEFPARFQLIAAMNPCPCGYFGDARGRCHCSADQVLRYRSRLSGPLLDRIDMHVELPALPAKDLLQDAADGGEATAIVAARVCVARDKQMARQGKLNARLNAVELPKICRIDATSRALLTQAIERLGLSARAYHRVLKVARSCADLANRDAIEAADIAEAIRLRALDRGPAGSR